MHSRFIDDHHDLDVKVAAVLAAVEAQDPAAAALWSAFAKELLTHLDVEETHMVPALLKSGERRAAVLIEEHRHIRHRAAEIGRAFTAHIVSREIVRDFIDELRAHTESEDRLLYGKTPSE